MSDLNMNTGALLALTRMALNSRCGSVQLAFQERDSPIFDVPDHAIAKVSDGQVVLAWDASFSDLERVLKFADPANFEPGEMPEQYLIAREPSSPDASTEEAAW